MSKYETIQAHLREDVEHRTEARNAQIRARQGLARCEAELGAATMAYFDADQALDEHLLDLSEVMGLGEPPPQIESD